MKLQCSAQELITGLVNATRALSARPATQVLECVKLSTEEESFTLTCTDGSLTVFARVKAQIEEPGEVLLPGRLFAEIARKLPEGSVSIQMNEKRVATIRCGSSPSASASGGGCTSSRARRRRRCGRRESARYWRFQRHSRH